MVTNFIPSEEIADDLFNIHDGNLFPFPDLSDNCYFDKKVIIDSGRIIGYSLTRLTSEFSLMLDKRASLRTRVLAAQELQRKAIKDAIRLGIKDTHIFTNDLSVAKFAEHLGFRECPEKKALSLRFGYE